MYWLVYYILYSNQSESHPIPRQHSHNAAPIPYYHQFKPNVNKANTYCPQSRSHVHYVPQQQNSICFRHKLDMTVQA